MNAVGVGYLKRTCGKSRLDQVRNEWVKQGCGISETIQERPERGYLRKFGHVKRMGKD